MPAGDVLVHAKTVEEAVEKASRILEATPSEVEYDVIRDEASGAQSGPGDSEVLIRVRRRGDASGRPPSKGAARVGPRAKETAPMQIEVSVSADRLTASVRVIPSKVTGSPMDRTLVEPYACHCPCESERDTREGTVTVEDVEEALRAKGVVFGIDRDAVETAILEADGLQRVVAKGIPPVEGKDGFVEYLVELEPVPVVWEEAEERIDYWERYRFPFVHAGSDVAVLHPPVPGTPGRAVTGETIYPREVRAWVLKAGDGAQLSDDGTRVVALRDGKPTSHGSRYTCVEVEPVIVHQGNVGLASGHLRFNGDIVVRGDVLEGARVEGRGGVTVLGHVAGATIVAGEGVKIKGSVVNSRIRSGGTAALAASVAPLVAEIGSTLTWLDQVLQEVVAWSQGLTTQEGQRRLISSFRQSGPRLRELGRTAASVKELIAGAPVGLEHGVVDAARSLAEVARRVAALGPLEVPSSADLKTLRGSADTIADWVEGTSGADGGVVVGYAQNSVIESGGDILVAEKGCYNCRLSAGGGVRVKGNVRGGEISAGRQVQVVSVGTPGQWPCSSVMRVARDGQIRAGAIYPGTVLQVGAESFVFESTRFDVRAYLDDQGVLAIR